MICLIQNVEDYNNDLRVMLQAFYPGVKIVIPDIFEKKPELKKEIKCVFTAEFKDAYIYIRIYDCDGVETNDAGIPVLKYAPSDMTEVCIDGDYTDRAAVRNPLKLAIYNMLSARTGKLLPWGTLTGIRPTKIAMAAIVKGKKDDDIVADYKKIYNTSEAKAALSVKVAHREKIIIDSVDGRRDYCLYIGIPFCPSRCLYCSFTSYPIAMYADKVDAYLDALEREMLYVSQAYKNRRLVSVYVGGGTPSSIDAAHIDRLCAMIEKYFDLQYIREYTIEAGRPDSITYDKLRVMKAHKVTRISINPQTMNDETLKLIGRAHKAAQTVEVMQMARHAGFDNINMDLIAGLPGEDKDSFENTLMQIKQLAPESLTVHSLAIKRAANLNIYIDEYKNKLTGDTESQLNLVDTYATDMKLIPYYLYRQKNISGNLENVGYSEEGLECLYNILIMEEITDIVGLGAGSSTKVIFREGQRDVISCQSMQSECPVDIHLCGTRIERTENCKSIDDYIMRIDEMIARKKKLFED